MMIKKTAGKFILHSLYILLYILYFSRFNHAMAATGKVQADVTSDPKEFTTELISAEPFSNPHFKVVDKFEFTFTDGKEVHVGSEITAADSRTPNIEEKYDLELWLTFDKNAFMNKQHYFINGKFTYQYSVPGDENFFSGNVSGLMAMISEKKQSPDHIPAFVLELRNDSMDFIEFIYMSVPDNFWTQTGEVYAQEQSPLPIEANATEMAAGVAVSAIGISLLNAATKSSMLGSVTFSMGIPTTTGTPSIFPGVRSTAGGIRGKLKNLLLSLRDMLTDEGRSYTSGKVSENINSKT